jgi:hypothetical protein
MTTRTLLPPRNAKLGDNGGPPLEEETPRCKRAPKVEPIGAELDWRLASRRAWRKGGREIALRRLERAEAIGLTYEEYTLEILERARHVGLEDVPAIKAKRRERRKAGTITGQSLKGMRLG